MTHLEKPYLSGDRLPLEIFDDFLTENEQLKKKIDERSNKNKAPLRAKSYYFLLNGDKLEADANVIDYDR